MTSRFDDLGVQVFNLGCSRMAQDGHTLDEEGVAKAKKATAMMAKHFGLMLTDVDNMDTHLTAYAHSADIMRRVPCLAAADAGKVFVVAMGDVLNGTISNSVNRYRNYTLQKLVEEKAADEAVEAQRKKEEAEAAEAAAEEGAESEADADAAPLSEEQKAEDAEVKRKIDKAEAEQLRRKKKKAEERSEWEEKEAAAVKEKRVRKDAYNKEAAERRKKESEG